MNAQEYFQKYMEPEGWIEDRYSYTYSFESEEYGETLDIFIDKGVNRDPYLSSADSPYINDEVLDALTRAKQHNDAIVKAEQNN